MKDIEKYRQEFEDHLQPDPDFNKELPTKVTVVLGVRRILMVTKNARFDSVEQAVEYGYNALKYFPGINIGVISVLLEQQPQYKERFWKTAEALREFKESIKP